jgi:zinc transport system substrate-binding protein
VIRPTCRGARALLTLVALVEAPACAPPTPPEGSVPLVVVTIFPMADLASAVAGDALAVETLLPPRASLHTWEAMPAQIRALSHAAGYVTVGGGLDGWLEGLGADRGDLATLRLTDGMTLSRGEHAHEREGEGDPHVWLDPILVRDALLPRLTDFLAGLVPADQAAGIRTRAAAVADSLTALDAEIRATLTTVPRRGFIATHEAWTYFARRYDLEDLGSLYEGPGHEPSARGLARLVDAARATGLGAVLTEPQLAETAARALADEVGADVVVVDPLGGRGVPDREGYFQLMRFNARAFSRALGRTRGNP